MTRLELLEIAKPILLNTEMIRAIQDGRKTVTRQVLKPHNPVKAKKFEYYQGSGLWYDDTFNEGDKDTHIKDYTVSCCWIGTKIYIQKYAPYKVGDYIYVRETWTPFCINKSTCVNALLSHSDYCFKASLDSKIYGCCDTLSCKWRPSIHMPKKVARIFLRVTDVRVERLQDITSEQICREGIICEDPYILNGIEKRYAFQSVWDSTVKKSDLAKYGWDANPWVWVIEFERVEVE